MPDTPPTDDPLLADQHLDELLGNLLRFGVLLSAAVVLAGGLDFLAAYGGERVADHSNFRGEPESLCSVHGVIRSAAGADSRGIIQLGVLLLIATPIARVIFSVFAFFAERDYLYVVVTLIVLVTLLYSLLFSG